MRVGWNRIFLLLLASFISAPCAGALAQKETPKNDGGSGGRRGGVRSMTIPVTIKLPEKRQEEGELQYLENFPIFEDNEQQEVLAARGAPT